MRGGQPNPHCVRESAYDASCETSPKLNVEKRNTMVALREQSRGVFSSFMFFYRAFGDASHETW